MKSVDRCDASEVRMTVKGATREHRCPNRGEYFLTHRGIISGSEITLFLCRKHYQDGGNRHIDAPRREKPADAETVQ